MKSIFIEENSFEKVICKKLASIKNINWSKHKD